ncbi:Crp/Fnr family transcriptional regulator [Lentibacillus cibarius]|uniref:Crp/Fnr family transcriptional regulator n=1 Tax=Lentibacillus cibarius TaxID=2583219 RepID=A0A549YEW7_9BACI|nr:Crp/Fnr family transcriptional regulator [Lentibacillus cibarius]TMN21516.1 Crp/Fnr family transcriptional regulator [Lentibacillus cibarius]TRM10415.1 Crp/Fnr family transcriptional regulator [Lentibacillus cibarius]
MSKLEEELTDFDFLSFFSDDELKRFKLVLNRRTYKKNQQLFAEGDKRGKFFFLKKGYIKLEKTNQEANMLYINYVKPNELFPYVGLFTEENYRYSAYALTDVSVYYLPVTEFESLIRYNTEQLMLVIKKLDQLTKRHQDRLQTVSTNFASDRVEQALNYLVQNFSVNQGDCLVIDIPMTMTELAKLSSTSRETVSQVFKKLKCDGIMTLNKRQITIHNWKYFREKNI